jgi:hypothetical protein
LRSRIATSPPRSLETWFPTTTTLELADTALFILLIPPTRAFFHCPCYRRPSSPLFIQDLVRVVIPIIPLTTHPYIRSRTSVAMETSRPQTLASLTVALAGTDDLDRARSTPLALGEGAEDGRK